MAVALAYDVGEALLWGVIEPTVVFLSTEVGQAVGGLAVAATAAGVGSAEIIRRSNHDSGHIDDDYDDDFPVDDGPAGGVIDNDAHNPRGVPHSDGPPVHTFVDEMRKDAHREFKIYRHYLLSRRHHVFGPAFLAGLYKFCRRFWVYLNQRERAQLLQVGHRRLSDGQYRYLRNIALSMRDAGYQATPVRRARDFVDPWSTPKRRRH